jgi:hypothetical protein
MTRRELVLQMAIGVVAGAGVSWILCLLGACR